LTTCRADDENLFEIVDNNVTPFIFYLQGKKMIDQIDSSEVQTQNKMKILCGRRKYE
jgi:hypothetical protein